jgi:hypothetical protein
MTKKRTLIILACALLAMAGLAQAQSATGTTTLSVTVGPEASLTVTNGTTTLATAGTVFNAYTGTTNLAYKIRTTKSTGSGTVVLEVTTDFAGAGGPSVGTPPTAGDALTYTCTVTGTGTACSAQTASHSATTPVVNFGAGAGSSTSTAAVAWSLTNDPVYATGTYTATTTFTIAST